jgi:cbb3-type cytochrome oxidase subunit 3
MEKNVLQSIAGVTVYPLISFAIFFLFFIGLLGYVLIANRQHLSDMSQLPLESNDEETPKSTLNHDILC